MHQGNSNQFPPEQQPALAAASASVIGTHPGTPILSQLQAGGPVISGLTSFGQGQTWSEHAPGSYGNAVCYGDEYYFYFMGGHARASLKGGRSCSLGTRNY